MVIVGGGPAGLSAALVLGRCRRRVLICDNGHPRNAASRAIHYCDAWEWRDRALAVIGAGRAAAALALALKTWSACVSLYTNGPPRLQAPARAPLAAADIPLHCTPISRIEHEAGRLRRIAFVDGRALDCDAAFLSTTQAQQSELARRLGCELTRRGTVKTDHLGRTCVPGVYVAGDTSRDVQFVIVAAAEGAKAGVSINRALQERAGLVLEDTGGAR